MKLKFLLSVTFGMLFFGGANAANITLYYSPSCPHCHHARDFIGGELVYEYPTISVDAVNVTADGNFPMFEKALKKCEFTSGGVPVIVIGEKCFQGYADFMKQELRDAVAVDMSDADKAAADANRKLMESDADAFKAANAARANAINETDANAQKKTESNPVIYFYILLGVLVLGLGFILVRKKK